MPPCVVAQRSPNVVESFRERLDATQGVEIARVALHSNSFGLHFIQVDFRLFILLSYCLNVTWTRRASILFDSGLP